MTERAIQMGFLLEALKIETGPSGTQSIRLTERVGWEDFENYASRVLQALDAQFIDRCDTPVERYWKIRIDQADYLLFYQDYPQEVTLDPCDDNAKRAIETVYERLASFACK